MQRGSGLFLLFILCTVPRIVWAQSLSGNERPSDTPPIITEVRFSGNEFFSDEDLALHVRTRANRRFLNIPGVTWWRWIYQLGESGKLGEGLSRALLASGEAPAYLDSTLIAADVERLRLFYRQEGFRDAKIEARIDTHSGGSRARVTYQIEPGKPTFIREVRYEGVDALNAVQRQLLVRNSLLRPPPPRLITGEALAFRPRDQRYSEPTLSEERRRILAFLRDQGYAAVSRDSIRAIVFPEQSDSFDVTFRINPGPRHRFGDVHFSVAGPEEDVPAQQETFVVSGSKADTTGIITVQIEDEGKLDSGLLMRSLRFRPGDFYDQSRLLATKRRLEGTGVFSFTDIVPLSPDTTDTTFAEPLLPHQISLRTRRRHQVRLETFLQQQTSAGASYDEFGTGAGISYQNLNFLGGGEVFQIGLTGSVGADLGGRSAASGVSSSPFSSAQAEITTSLTYPYLIAPFGSLDRLLDLYDARTRLSFSLLTARRDQLRLIIRGRGAARARFELQHTPTVASLVDLFDVTLSNPDTLPGFRENFLDDILSVVRDSVQIRQIHEDYTQPQVNSALRYTLRSSNVNPLRRDRGYSYEASFEVGGNLLYLLDRFAFTPGTLEGTLPGLPFFRGNRANNELIYRQYVRLLADLRRYHRPARGRTIAWHIAAGAAQPIGNSTTIPFDRRFYAGGASSIRGWALRSLGPGPLGNYQGGEIKLETGAELRSRLVGNLFAAEWSGVFFADAGNVWLRPRTYENGAGEQSDAGQFKLDRFYKEIAVGSGIGVRIAWEYLIARIDLAWKVYDPTFVPENPDKGLFPYGLSQPVLHFGIGHTF